MDQPIYIRPASESDATELLDIYRPFVESTAASFEFETPSVAEFAARITKSVADWQWLVAEQDERCIGYAYGTSHRARAAYQWSVEVSAYVHPGHLRRGVGRMLYTQLFEDLARRGYRNAYAGIALPNDASIALHRGVGFEYIGTFKSVGRKFDRWHDVAWYQRPLPDLGATNGGGEDD